MPVRTPPATSAPAASTDPLLLRAVAYMLRPLVRFMIARGITYPTLCEVLKRIYLRVASEQFALDGRRLTDSRISLLTGLHRKDVKRLREEPEEAMETPRMVTWGSRLVSLWLALPEYRGPDGQPSPLPRRGTQAGDISFESLATRVTRDIGARGILDELLRSGIVRIDEEEQVHLEIRAFVPHGDQRKKLDYFARNLHDHLATAVHNMTTDGPPMLERSVDVGRLSDEAIATLQELAESHGMQALVAINEAATALPRKNHRPGPAGRIRFGVYFLRDHGDEKF